MIAALWKSKNPLTSFETGNEIHFTKKTTRSIQKIQVQLTQILKEENTI